MFIDYRVAKRNLLRSRVVSAHIRHTDHVFRFHRTKILQRISIIDSRRFEEDFMKGGGGRETFHIFQKFEFNSKIFPILKIKNRII